MKNKLTLLFMLISFYGIAQVDSTKNGLTIFYENPKDSITDIQVYITLTKNKLSLMYPDHTDNYAVKTKGRDLTKATKFKFRKKDRGGYLELVADDKRKVVTEGKLHLKKKRDIEFFTLR